ncbi:MAG: RNA-binding domain-containing protein, partial [Acidobacteriota bacterium]
MFQGNPPVIRSGYRTETELWDFKRDCPHVGSAKPEAVWAEISKDVLAFYNKRGGLLIFGVTDDLSFCGATTRLDSKLINDQIRRYLGDRIWVEFHREFIQEDQRYLGVALVPPRGSLMERFKSDAPDLDGRRLFQKGDTAIRDGDSSRVLPREEAKLLARGLSIPTLGKVYEIDEPFFRILSPDYEQFVRRAEPCNEIKSALSDPRAAIASVVGIGGVGKTALGTWAALDAYDRKQFDFIVSVTAKDRELTAAGIQALKAPLTSFETLLDNVLEVLKFSEYKSQVVEEKEKQVRAIIDKTNGLLYVDNLETVDDKRIINFLDSLPLGVRAITTSRRSQVRVSVRPVDLGPLMPDEVIALVRSLVQQPGLGYVADLSDSECLRVGEACDRIALAIRWALVRSSGPGEALTEAESITRSGIRGEQLLEFCFRRVFDSLDGAERKILEVLSLFQRPLPLEAVLVGASLPHYKFMDAAEALVEDTLAQRLFDPELNDYTYTLLPIARAFVYSQVSQGPALEGGIRNRLSDYFEAKDIKDSDERLVIREMRQGKEASESALVDLAQAAERRRDYDTATHLYEQALRRNPTSWRASRL